MTNQYLDQRVVEAAIERARAARKIGRFSKTREGVETEDPILKQMGNIPLVGALTYTRNNVLKIYCGIVGYDQETPQLAGVWIQNIDPEAVLDDRTMRNRQYQGCGAVQYEIPESTLDFTIEEVRKCYGIERGFSSHGVTSIGAPVFEKVLLGPRTEIEIADAIISVDRAGEAWTRALGKLESEMGAVYRQAIEIKNRRY